MEIWKTIEGTENHYEVSNLGNFKLDGKPIDTVIDSTGYVKVRIAFPIGTRWFWVHRIVAVYFCERFNDKNQVNHIDGVKTNNKSNNLEWCTNTENQKHRINVLGKDCKGTTNTDYLVIVKVVQNLSYCTRSLVGYREVTRTKTTYECFIMPQEEGASAPQISANYDYDVFINHCNYVVPNIARTRNHAIVVSIRNSASA